MSEAPDVQGSLDRYRAVRQRLEEEILPLATSVDGRRFTYQASLHGLSLQAGSYVALEQGSKRRLGQIVTLGVGEKNALELTADDECDDLAEPTLGALPERDVRACLQAEPVQGRLVREPAPVDRGREREDLLLEALSNGPIPVEAPLDVRRLAHGRTLSRVTHAGRTAAARRRPAG